MVVVAPSAKTPCNTLYVAQIRLYGDFGFVKGCCVRCNNCLQVQPLSSLSGVSRGDCYGLGLLRG